MCVDCAQRTPHTFVSEWLRDLSSRAQLSPSLSRERSIRSETSAGTHLAQFSLGMSARLHPATVVPEAGPLSELSTPTGSGATRILVAEDDGVTAHVLSQLLDSWGFDVTTVSDGLAALAVLQSDDAPPMAVLDWVMPGLDGPDVCRKVRQRRPRVPTYIILLTSREGRMDVVTGLEAGADDYVIKPPDPGELRARLKAGMRVLDAEHHFARIAMVDALTGLRNRRWFDETFPRQHARSLRAHQPVSLLMIDVDEFNQFNNTFGHVVGDAVLRHIAQALTEHLRPADMLARYGGEEFGLLLPNTDFEEAMVVAERLRQAVCQQNEDKRGDPVPPTAVSIGVATSRAPEPLGDLLLRADAALYRAKEAGRNCVKG
jgi:two-component system cell cycle response regulator